MAQARIKEIIRILKRTYPEAQCSLDFGDPFQLLVSTILSAQCTDERVNQVTPALFKKFPGPKEMARAPIGEIEELIKTTGFFRSKALSLKQTSEEIVAKHAGKVPRSIDELTSLRGVGRKTANVVLGVAFGEPEGVVVDTHVGRISRRLGLTKQTDPVKVERALGELVPREDWVVFSHLLIDHGRAICTARTAMCEACPIRRLCPKIGVAKN
jgi:endonuclease-3